MADRFYGTGRRKKSIARVYLVPGTGKITINKRDIDDYFGLETLKVIVRQALVATETTDKFDILVNVHGGGTTGQAGAIRHGIARAVSKQPVELRSSRSVNRDQARCEKPWKFNVSGVFSFAISAEDISGNRFLLRESAAASAGACDKCNRQDRTGQLFCDRAVLGGSVSLCL